MKKRRILPACERAQGFVGFTPKPPDTARRVAWCIVAAATVVLAVPVALSIRDIRAREEAAAEALKMEDIRIARQSRERHAKEDLRRVEDSFRREEQWNENQKQDAARARTVLDARRTMQASERDLRDAQDRLMRESRQKE